MTVRLTTLNNGLRVVTDAMPHLKTATVGVWVDAGARDESAAENGVAHLLDPSRRGALWVHKQQDR